MTEARSLTTTSAEQTRAVARQLGARLSGGELLALSGPLGAGKTQFVKGLAAGLEVPREEPVTSPTFVLVREYAGRLRLYHLDAYRLTSGQELIDIGIEEMLSDEAGVVVVEWADRVADVLPPAAWDVRLEHAGEGARLMRLRGPEATDWTWLRGVENGVDERRSAENS